MVTNNYFKIYLSQVFALAETLVIKSEASAHGINQRIQSLRGVGSVDLGRPETWKYYMNLAGEYHPEDEMMRIVSLDTLERIDFTKESLRIHRATARAYQYGNRLFKELITRFPKQEQLILGILYPVDKEKAISAKEGTILGYPEHLVEFNEYSFIQKLQDWVYKYRKQNRNPQYAVSDELFESVLLGQFYMHLVPAILNIRLRACRTNEAHSYHVRSYLASHGFLDEYLDHLTVEQSLWCYRNINYIERFAGHQDTFDWLVENILTKRQIPIAEYTMKHDTTYQPNGVEPFDLENIRNRKAYYPDVLFKKRSLNHISGGETALPVTLEEIFNKEDRIAFDNPRYKYDDRKTAQEKMENALSNTLLTKALESSMYDYSDSMTYSLTDVILGQWIKRSYEGSYRAVISINNPRSGEVITLRSLDAIYVLYWLMGQKTGRPLSKLPTLIAGRVPREPRPSDEDLLKHTPPGVISENALQVMKDLMPQTSIAYSVDAFYEDSLAYWEAANLQNILVSQYEHLVERSYAENVVTRFYATVQYPPREDLTYDTWFERNNIHIQDLSEEERDLLFDSIINTGSGANLQVSTNARSLQKAMLKLMTQLSSYSIQFLGDINKSNIKQLDLNRVRVGDRIVSVASLLNITGMKVDILDVGAEAHQEAQIDGNQVDENDELYQSAHASVEINLPTISATDGFDLRYHYVMDIPRIEIDYALSMAYPNKFGLPPMWRPLNPEDWKVDEHNYGQLPGEHDYGCSIRVPPPPKLSSNFNRTDFGAYRDFRALFANAIRNVSLSGFEDVGKSVAVNLRNSGLKAWRVDKPSIGVNLTDVGFDVFKDVKPDVGSIFRNSGLSGFHDVPNTDLMTLVNTQAIGGEVLDVSIIKREDVVNLGNI